MCSNVCAQLLHDPVPVDVITVIEALNLQRTVVPGSRGNELLQGEVNNVLFSRELGLIEHWEDLVKPQKQGRALARIVLK